MMLISLFKISYISSGVSLQPWFTHMLSTAYCAVFLTILLGQKVPKTIRSNSGFLKNSIPTKLKERSICKTTAPKIDSVRWFALGLLWLHWSFVQLYCRFHEIIAGKLYLPNLRKQALPAQNHLKRSGSARWYRQPRHLPDTPPPQRSLRAGPSVEAGYAAETESSAI